MAKPMIIITGCSGGGKSTLLAELTRRGFHTVTEPGRRIVRSGMADPVKEPETFAAAAMAMSLEDIKRAEHERGPVFFDRGLIDAAAALNHVAGIPLGETVGNIQFFRKVAFAPPWLAIYENDAERPCSFQTAQAEADRLEAIYPALGYELLKLPLVPVGKRADWLLEALGPLEGA